MWKARLKFQLQSAPQDPIITETLELLESGFKTGFTDVRDFDNLKAKLRVISEQYAEIWSDTHNHTKKEKLGKGTKVNTAFDEYTLIKQVGSGGNGRVFSATNKDGEKFAIKFLDKTISAEKLKRFKNEINFCEQHSHKNIVPILDRGYAYLDETDMVFYVMPLYEETLKQKIKNGIAAEAAVGVFIGIIEGLQYAHRHNAIHRDIKPENILFGANSLEPIICDFGIAHFAEEDLLTAIETKPGERMANFYYAAPEQYKKGVATCPQTDLYSAGLILNEMFTREIPQAADYKTISSVNAEYGFLDEIFIQLFKQNPGDRLYPEERIISELKRLAEKHQKDAEKARLQSLALELATPDSFEAKLSNKTYKDGMLLFEFEQNLPDEWVHMLIYGSYSCSAAWGYEHENLEQLDSRTLAMPLQGYESEPTIKSIVENLNQWISIINEAYGRAMKNKAAEELRIQEALRDEQIKKINQDSALNAFLASL